MMITQFRNWTKFREFHVIPESVGIPSNSRPTQFSEFRSGIGCSSPESDGIPGMPRNWLELVPRIPELC
jgi:hypothetical protein